MRYQTVLGDDEALKPVHDKCGASNHKAEKYVCGGKFQDIPFTLIVRPLLPNDGHGLVIRNRLLMLVNVVLPREDICAANGRHAARNPRLFL